MFRRFVTGTAVPVPVAEERETKEGERSVRRVSRRARLPGCQAARVDGRNEICTKKGGGGREEKRLGNPGSIVVAVECRYVGRYPSKKPQ